MSPAVASETSDSIAVRAACFSIAPRRRACSAVSSRRAKSSVKGSTSDSMRVPRWDERAMSAPLRACCSTVSAPSGSVQLSMAEISLSPGAFVAPELARAEDVVRGQRALPGQLFRRGA